MPLPVITNVALCAIKQSLHGQLVVNVIGVTWSGSHTAADIAKVVAEAWGHGSSFADAQVTDLTYTSVDCTILDGTSPTVSDNFGTAAHAHGTRSLTAAPPSLSFIHKLLSTERGKSHNGRMYISGAAVTDIGSDPSTWGSSYTSLQATAINTFTAQLAAGTPALTQGIVSRKLSQFTAVDSFVGETTIGTQRKRLRS